MSIEYINTYDKLEVALKHMKSHDSTQRIQGINLFTEFISTNYILLSVNIIQRLRLVFECEHNTEVLLQLSKLCTNLGLISLFEDSICKLNMDDFGYFSKGCIISNASRMIYNAYKDSPECYTLSLSDKKSVSTIEKISSIIPILQDIAELDDVYVRMETLKSLKSLINIITFILEEYFNNMHNCAQYYDELTLMFNNSLEIFQKLASSDIISHKILSCHIIPLILEQKRLSEIFVDEKNILLSKYSDFCVHPAPTLRKHASKVFNSILDQIEFEESMIEILVFPTIQNFCCDEQEGVRLMAIENIEAFFLQTIELAQSNNEYIKNVFIFFERLQPYIFILYNDTNWRIRSNVSRSIINIYIKLFQFEEFCEMKNIDIREYSTNIPNKVNKNEDFAGYNENESQNLHALINEGISSTYSCSRNDLEKSSENEKNNPNENDTGHLNKLAFILTQLLMDPEPETRMHTLSNLLKTIEEQILKSKSSNISNKALTFRISNVLFYEVIIKQINNNNNTLLLDPNTSVRTNLARILKIIILIRVNFQIDKHMNNELENTFDTLITKLISDENNQVRQSVVLALCSGVSESDDIDFLINKILPYSNSITQDSFWRVRYCSVILLILSLYKILLSRFNGDEIWGGNISNSPDEVIKSFFNYHRVTIDALIELIIMNISDKTSIIRQLTSIFALPLLSNWFGHEWTKNQLWSKSILPMVLNEKSYTTRVTGLLSANSIISGVNIHSFEELLDAIRLITQLIFTVAPTFDSINIEESNSYKDFRVNDSNIFNHSEAFDQNIDFFLDEDSYRGNKTDLHSYVDQLAEYLPLINASNLILSLKSSNASKANTKKPRNISPELNEFQLEIVSVILQSSVNDGVPNVRVKAFQTISSLINANRLGDYRKPIIDQVKYSFENDPDFDVRAYCLDILKNDKIELEKINVTSL